MTDGGAIHADQLCGYVARIENLDKGIAELNAQKVTIYKEAKAVGFDAKVLRRLVSRRQHDQTRRDDEDEALELYEQIVNSHTKEVDPLA